VTDFRESNNSHY